MRLTEAGRRFYTLESALSASAPGAPGPLALFETSCVRSMHGDEATGRELLSAFVLAFANSAAASPDNRALRLLQRVVVYIIPTLNPDGYERIQRENENGALHPMQLSSTLLAVVSTGVGLTPAHICTGTDLGAAAAPTAAAADTPGGRLCTPVVR